MFAIPKVYAKNFVRYQARNVRRASTTQSQHSSQHPQNPQHPQHTEPGKWYWPNDPTNRAAMYFVYAMLAGSAFALLIGDPFPDMKIATESKETDPK